MTALSYVVVLPIPPLMAPSSTNPVASVSDQTGNDVAELYQLHAQGQSNLKGLHLSSYNHLLLLDTEDCLPTNFFSQPY